jgi:dTDP-4-dehydrorhamnose 3,5-epimerase
MAKIVQPVPDEQTVTPEGELTFPRIKDLVIRPLRPLEDRRGEVIEVYRPSWGVNTDPLVYVYQVGIRPGAIKGWTMHRRQEDRIYVCRGYVRFGLFDNRPDSPTYKLLNKFTFSERNRALIIIPRGVFHAIQNVGETEAIFVNMPTAPYDHEDPDKVRLPVKNDLIPFDFDDGPGW